MNGEVVFSIFKLGVAVQANLPKETALNLRDQINAMFPGEERYPGALYADW
jgi:hypothetical protein